MTPGRFSDPIPVSTLTVLQDYALLQQQALIAIINLDPAETVTVVLYTSEDGVHFDEPNEVEVPPLRQRSFRLSPVDGYCCLKAYTAAPHPVALVKWIIRYV